MSIKLTTMNLKDDGVIKSIGAERKVIVYSKPNCPNCEHVKWGLGAQEVPFEVREIEVTAETDAKDAEKHLREFISYGFMAAPVTVFPNGKVMDGFHHGKFVDRMREMGYDL